MSSAYSGNAAGPMQAQSFPQRFLGGVTIENTTLVEPAGGPMVQTRPISSPQTKVGNDRGFAGRPTALVGFGQASTPDGNREQEETARNRNQRPKDGGNIRRRARISTGPILSRPAH